MIIKRVPKRMEWDRVIVCKRGFSIIILVGVFDDQATKKLGSLSAKKRLDICTYVNLIITQENEEEEEGERKERMMNGKREKKVGKGEGRREKESKSVHYIKRSDTEESKEEKHDRTHICVPL